MPTSTRGWMAEHPRAVDVAIAVAMLVLSLLAVPATPETAGLDAPRLTPVVVASLVVACGALLWRRSHPVLVWAVTMAAAVAPLPAGSVGRGLPAAVAALYAVAAYAGRRAAVLAAGTTMVVVLVVLSQSSVVEANDPVSYAVVAWCGLAAALGDAVRSNREVLAAALERARVAEEGREAEAQARVTEERLRISRELHDVVAHHVAVVNVQAGVAEHLSRSDPDAAAAALGQVRAASGQALQEMGAIVGLLRADVGVTDGQVERALQPAPDASDIPRLVESARGGGAVVTWQHRGEPLGGTAAHDLHLYRIVQEALTNATRYGTGPVSLRTATDDEEVLVEVDNEVAAAAASGRGPGHGLVGMRERATLAGGTFSAGPADDGHFSVRVALPREVRRVR